MNQHDKRLFLILAVPALIGLALYFGLRPKGDMAVVKVEGTLYGTYDITKSQSITIHASDGWNKLVIENGAIYMEDADCPDKLCVKHGRLIGTQDSIVCLPHKVVVTLQKKMGEESGLDATAQ